MAEIFLMVCDLCAQSDRQSAASTTVRLTIDDDQLRIDACDDHAAELTQTLDRLRQLGWQEQQTAARVSSRPGRKSPSELLRMPGATGCPVCYMLLSSPGNANHHVKKVHLRKVEEWTADDRERATREARRRLADSEASTT